MESNSLIPSESLVYLILNKLFSMQLSLYIFCNLCTKNHYFIET